MFLNIIIIKSIIDLGGVLLWELRERRWRSQQKQQKGVGLDKQNNNFACASRFFVISFSSLHDYYMYVKMPNFMFCHKTTTFCFFSSTSMQSFRIQPGCPVPIFPIFSYILSLFLFSPIF